MTYANMDNVPTQVSGSSSVLATDWNTYVRDNFDDIKAGHVVVADATARAALGTVTSGTMVFEVSTNKLWVYTNAWYELANFTQNTAVGSGGGPYAPSYSPVGEVTAFAGSAAPTGWLLCNGASLSTSANPEYTALFGIIGTTYGGSGATAFNVPNLQGRVIVGAGTGAQNGASGTGTISGGTSLTARARGDWFGDQYLQAHTHTGSGTTGSASATATYASIVNNTSFASGSGIGQRAIVNSSQAGGIGGYEGLNSFNTAPDHTHGYSFTTSAHNQTQGAQANLQPSLVLNYIIKY